MNYQEPTPEPQPTAPEPQQDTPTSPPPQAPSSNPGLSDFLREDMARLALWADAMSKSDGINPLAVLDYLQKRVGRIVAVSQRMAAWN